MFAGAGFFSLTTDNTINKGRGAPDVATKEWKHVAIGIVPGFSVGFIAAVRLARGFLSDGSAPEQSHRAAVAQQHCRHHVH